MAYEVIGSFQIALPDDYQEMGVRLGEISAAWQQFVGQFVGGVVTNKAQFELRNCAQAKHRRTNGTRRGRPPRVANVAQDAA
jgi:hypothetical protein